MIDSELQTGLDSIQTETKNLFLNLQARCDGLKSQNAEMQRQLDALDAKSQGRLVAADAPKDLATLISEHPAYQERKAAGFSGRSRLVMEFPGVSPFQTKTNITDATLGVQSTGTIPLVRLPGVPGMARQGLRIRDLMNVINVNTGSAFDYAKQSVRTNATSPQVEAQPKAESTYLWNSVSDTFRTIAHFTNVSRQALDDVPWLRNQLDSELIYGLKLKEENEILSGSGTGVHLNGIITQATAFDTATYNVAADGWTYLDQLRSAKLQARLAGLATYAPSAYVLHPSDMAKIELLKSTLGLYVVGNPLTGAPMKYIWDLPVVESDSISAGTFLVGAFDSAVQLIDRMVTTVEISFEHASNFTSNLCTILAELRIGLAVQVPTAFITGSFSRSPQ
jgi:HK97 family phage major capsid protein